MARKLPSAEAGYAEAVAGGMVRYFGNPCSGCGGRERYVISRSCVRCMKSRAIARTKLERETIRKIREAKEKGE